MKNSSRLTCALPVAIVLLAATFQAAPVAAQEHVTYEISFPNAVHHEAEVMATFTGVPQGTPLEVRMSRSSPGRYALHEFAKNVYAVKADDGSGTALEVTRPNPHQWDVHGHHGTVRVTYTLFGDRADGTYDGIDNSHAHLNMPATFMWARGMDDAPITVTFHKPDPAWGIATQLFTTDDPDTFTAPGLQYFMDSPTEISPFDLRTWTVTSNGKTYPMRLAVHHNGTSEQLDTYAEMAKKVVAQEIAVYGETPDYDPGYYTFIADYLPWDNGDGMEHRNSTIIVSTQPLEGRGLMRNLGTLSHEFFHQWNVERIRPKGIEPFDFEHANMTSELWFAEGFTSYYDDLFIRRAGLSDDDRYASGLSFTIDAIVNDPGRMFFSPMGMSRQAPFVDAATSVDPQNKRNTFISYYTWGAGLGLALDLTLRSQFDGVTLDDLMRAMWKKYGKTEIPYTNDDLKATLAEVTGDDAFTEEFFGRYVEGQEAPDYEALLAHAGFLLRKRNPGKVWIDARLGDDDGKVTITSPTLIGGPLYKAGLDRRDVILRVADTEVTSLDDLRPIIESATPGTSLTITFEQRGQTKTATVNLMEDPTLEVVTYETAGMTVTPEMQSFRDAWLGSKAGM